MSLLLEVSKNNHQEILDILHENPDDVYQTDNNGNTGLHIASEKGYYQIAQTLINNGSEINAQNKCPGWTAVHFAAYEGHVEILELLLDCGAKPNLKDWQGDTAETWALDWENYKCAMLLADATKKTSSVKNKSFQASPKENSDIYNPEDESNADTFDSDDDSDDDDDDEELTHWVLPLPKPIPHVASFHTNPSNIPNLPVSQSSKQTIVLPPTTNTTTPNEALEENVTGNIHQEDAKENKSDRNSHDSSSNIQDIVMPNEKESNPEFEVQEQNIPTVMSMIIELPEAEEELEQECEPVSNNIIVTD